MGLGQCISNTVLLDLLQLCAIDEKQYNITNVTGILSFHLPMAYGLCVEISALLTSPS